MIFTLLGFHGDILKLTDFPSAMWSLLTSLSKAFCISITVFLISSTLKILFRIPISRIPLPFCFYMPSLYPLDLSILITDVLNFRFNILSFLSCLSLVLIHSLSLQTVYFAFTISFNFFFFLITEHEVTGKGNHYKYAFSDLLVERWGREAPYVPMIRLEYLDWNFHSMYHHFEIL